MLKNKQSELHIPEYKLEELLDGFKIYQNHIE